MPLTMTAEREAVLIRWAQEFEYARELLAELYAERAAHQETQDQRDSAERFLVSAVELQRETQDKLAETQAITRELLAGAIKYHDQQECAWCYDDGQCDLADLIDKAKAKGVLPAAPESAPSLGKISTT